MDELKYYRKLFTLLDLEEEEENPNYGKAIQWPSLESLDDTYLDRLAEMFDVDRNDYTPEAFIQFLKQKHVPEGLMEQSDPRYPYPD